MPQVKKQAEFKLKTPPNRSIEKRKHKHSLAQTCSSVLESLKGTVTRFSTFGFFHQTTSPWPLIHAFLKIAQKSYRFLTYNSSILATAVSMCQSHIRKGFSPWIRGPPRWGCFIKKTIGRISRDTALTKSKSSFITWGILSRIGECEWSAVERSTQQQLL
jgi:hypothetical protein